MATPLAILIFFASSLFFVARRNLRYLRYFQQEQYNDKRYLAWFWKGKNFDTRATFTLLAVIAVIFVLFQLGLALSPLSIALVAGVPLIIVAFFEIDPRKEGKITLKMTPRAKRIYAVALVLYVLLAVLYLVLWANRGDISLMKSFVFVHPLLFQCLPLTIIVADLLLKPWERTVQRRFRNDAKRILREINPYVIGITGSYGKSSTKSILAQLLEASLGPTFWPPEGVNSPMGITRQIREKLKPVHKYAVIEMAAFQRGSIKRLCDLTPPQAGILTAVGEMHLERFGSKENIFRTKSELPQAIPNDGILVCNADNAGARRAAAENPKAQTLLYGIDAAEVDCRVSDVRATVEGSEFTLHWKGKAYAAKTPILGKPLLSNIAAAFTMGCALGADPEFLLAAIRNLTPVRNRLELQQSGSIVQLNDAYNSNPIGFRAALEVLAELPGERKILVTPGMIELGDEQEAHNEKVAEYAAQVCDLVAVIGDTNKDAILRGLRAGGIAERDVLLFTSRDEAFKELGTRYQAGDVVLVENDLPDLLETREAF